VAAAGIGHDREQGRATSGHQAATGGEVETALAAYRDISGVAIFGIVRVVEERIGGLIAFQIEDSEMLSRFDEMDPVVPRRDDFAVEGRGRVESGFGEHFQRKVSGFRFQVPSSC
jgi:hypothetical protein